MPATDSDHAFLDSLIQDKGAPPPHFCSRASRNCRQSPLQRFCTPRSRRCQPHSSLSAEDAISTNEQLVFVITALYTVSLPLCECSCPGAVRAAGRQLLRLAAANLPSGAKSPPLPPPADLFICVLDLALDESQTFIVTTVFAVFALVVLFTQYKNTRDSEIHAYVPGTAPLCICSLCRFLLAGPR